MRAAATAPKPACLFVYGTLRRRHARTHRLLGNGRFLGRASIAGTRYDLGRYPGVRRTRSGGRVAGELYELLGSDIDRRLARLDRYEGAEFRRLRVLARLGDGRRRRVWAYLLAAPPSRRALSRARHARPYDRGL